ncbi:MAG: hypothetical protein HRT36_05720 [Alphaproteobacteria bacterium]|nr:hypothetical protein [Alphaproteobacteria bacterium]
MIDKPDDEWLMIGASHGKVHASGARGGDQEMSRTKGGLNTKPRLAVDALPIPALFTQGTGADCKEADRLIDGPII